MWNKEEFGDINIDPQDTEVKLHQFDILAENGPLNDEEKVLRCQAKLEFWRLSKISESLWKQKSRVKWLRLGDRNTRFFQITGNNRFKRNLVGSVMVDGLMVVKPEQKKEAATNFFRNNFSEERRTRPLLEGLFPRKLSTEIVLQLEFCFEEKEILAVVQGCSNLRAPGPDCFKFFFVKKGWNFMKETIVQFFLEFHTNGKLTKGINSTFVVLIPKVACLVSFNDYRPISMVGWVYKVLSKVLANRIKVHMPSIIGEAQAAFVGGKQILDGILIANEAIHSWKHSVRGGLILKLDFQRAYDCVNWKFLIDMLARFGFGDRWCGWILECVSSGSMSILINGSASKEFHMQRGLRQGDHPFSLI